MKRGWRIEDGGWRKRRRFFFSILYPLSSIFFVGCADNKPTTQPASVQERQDQAMRDPFAYSPYQEKPDVSGGDLGHFDKDAFRKDLDDVLNP